MNDRRTIVIVAHDIGPNGGMEKHLREMITRLKSDMNVIVVASSLHLAEEESEGIRFVRIPVIRRPFPLKLLMFSVMASIRLLFIRRDILHTTGAIIWNRTEVSTVHFCHAGYRKETNYSRIRNNPSPLRKLNSWLAGHIALWMERLIFKPHRTKVLVAVSSRVQQECLEHFPYDESSVPVVPNGVDLDRFRPYSDDEKAKVRRKLKLREDARILLFMGGDWPRKGLSYVIDAFQKIGSKYPELHLVIVGRGDPEQYTNNIEDKYRHRILFAGVQPNPEEWFGASDLFIAPSDYETFSLVVHEAAAAGLVVLSTKVGGVEELIKDGINGFYIERDTHDIAIKLDKALSNWDAIRSMGMRARDSVQHLTWDEAYKKMLRVYDTFPQAGESHAIQKNLELRRSADES